jgi:hypothetical protein
MAADDSSSRAVFGDLHTSQVTYRLRKDSLADYTTRFRAWGFGAELMNMSHSQQASEKGGLLILEKTIHEKHTKRLELRILSCRFV